MRQNLLLLLAIMAFSLLAEAKPVSISTARITAINTLSSTQTDQKYTLNTGTQPIILQRDGKSLIYIFQLEPVGFIMVSADDASYPVIAYSTESNYQSENQPDNFSAWIKGYADQINYAIETNSLPDTKTLTAWENALNPVQNAATKSPSNTVAPMITSTWDQGAPYNYLCPEDQGGSGGHVWAGCVATAMSQVANYWRWPLQGTGSHGYNSSYGYLFADYGNSTYNWEEMTNSANGQNFQMAQIQYHMGIAVDMMYGPGGSGAYSDDAANALVNYFGMDAGTHLEYAPSPINDSWKSLIKSELEAGRPLYYHGFGSGGHAFNLDGYENTDYFHFNWGWSGSFNGYYYLDNLNPGGYSFTEGQGAIVGIQPTGSYPYYCNSTDTLRMYQGTIEDGSGPLDSYLGSSNCGWLIMPEDSILNIKLTFHRFDLGNEGDALVIHDGPDSYSPILATLSGSSIPTAVVSTGGAMFIKFTSNSGNNFGGWFASYVANKAIYCTGITNFTEPSGSVTDGSGTFDYRSNSVCRYRIMPDSAASITLTFDEFNTFDENDYLKIYNLNDGSLLYSLSGNQNPGTLVFNTGKLLLMFHSDNVNNANGWTFHYSSSVTTGIDEPQTIAGLHIYPNPANESLNLEFLNKNSQKFEISLIDLKGTKLLSFPETAGNNEFIEKRIEVSSIPGGVYLLKLASDNETITRKVIIRH